MFTFGGLLKLLGDLAALVGPLSITLIVEYIEVSTKLRQQPGVNRTECRRQQQSASTASLLLSPVPPTYRNAGLGVFPNGTINLNMHYPFNEWEQPDHRPESASSLSMLLYYPSWMDFIANGWVMAVLLLFASLTQGSLSQMSTHVGNMVGIRIRTSLQSLVYRKTLLISSNCFYECQRLPHNTDNGDGRNGKKLIDAGTINNLMSDDALNVMSFLWIAHYIWAIPLKVCRYPYIYIYYIHSYSMN